MTPHEKMMLYSMFYGSIISGIIKAVMYARKLLGIVRQGFSMHDFLRDMKKDVDIEPVLRDHIEGVNGHVDKAD